MDDLDDLLECEQDLLQEACAPGPPAKRLKATTVDEFDDDELLELAQTQMSKPKDLLGGATSSAAQQLSSCTNVGARCISAPIFSSTQEALQEEQEIAELVRLANSTVPGHDHAAGRQDDEDMPESSAAAAQRVQEASTSYSISTEAPSWSGANINGASMPITLQDGRRAFCRLHEQPSSFPAQSFLTRNKLLSAPIASMMQDVEQEAFAQALHDSKLLQANLRGSSPTHQPAKSPGLPLHGPNQKTLWVDKYSPKTFFDLLSDDQINREVVKWVKSWEACVHQKQTAPTAAHLQQGPEQKLLLLSGPPGLGKTTIAHVVARHCGYRPFEINASDDRTASALQSRIQDAVQMQSVLGKRKMNLVIVDEVDGIAGGSDGKGAVQVLLKLTQASGGKGGGQQEGEQAEEEQQVFGVKKKTKKAAQPLCRPIIAVCNDMYAPALRPLRGVAKIVQFKKPSAERLLQRLRAICQTENLVIDRAALTRLCEQTECDVRSCLNTLQFLARKGRPIKVADLNGLSIGQKDINKGAFTIWQSLLHNKRSASQANAQQDALLSSLQDFGDNPLVISGLHENMSGMRFRDMHLRGTAAIISQLCDADHFMAASQRRMDFSMQKYVPMCALAVRSIAAGPERPVLQWPKVHPQQVRRQTGQISMIQGWLEALTPAVFCTLNPRIAVQELLPSLIQVVNQPLRPVAQHLFNASEKATLATVVAVLVAYALTFDLGQRMQPAVLEGPTTAASNLPALTPAVHSLCSFPGLAQVQKVMPLALCQIVAHEVQLENIRQRDKARPTSAGNVGAGVVVNGSDSQAGTVGQADASSQTATAKLQFSVAQRMKEAGTGKVTKAKKGTWLDQRKLKQELDRKPLSAHQQRQLAHTAAGGATLRLPTRYKFHEGYTNAVKRPILMRDLLQCPT